MWGLVYRGKDEEFCGGHHWHYFGRFRKCLICGRMEIEHEI